MISNGCKLRRQILALLGGRDYRPFDKIEIERKLGLKSNERIALRKVLRELERSGEIARIRKNRYVLPAEADLVTGRLSIHQVGYGFLTSEIPGQADIFIAAENTGTAMHGDRVVARINRDVPPRPAKNRARHRTSPSDRRTRLASRHGRPEGRVIRILERARETIVGTLQCSRSFYYVVPDDPRFVHDVYVQVPPRSRLPQAPNRGDKVVVRLEAWESRHINPEGEIIEVLGPASAPGVDMLSIVRKYGLPVEFPKSVLEEANRVFERVDGRALEGREDLRDKFIVTIDPDDARDFDDAIHVDKIDNQGWQLGVHIADVAAYVAPGSALDREARRRGNSVYLPDRVIPMLPERLSNGVCSLNPGVDRLTHSVFIQFDKEGRTKNARFTKSVIRSTRRLTYKEAFAVLDSPPRDQLDKHLHQAWQLAALLRRKRFAHGALDLDFPEVKVRVDASGTPVRLERVENDESHQLIEEFMLAANEAVARELKHRSIPTIYRVHEDPDPEKLAEYREFVLSFNYKVGDLSHRAEIQRFLASIRGKPEEQALKIGLLKSLKRARYASQPLGHYGLAKANYLHFTSPIRRYADLVAHRALGRARSPLRAVGSTKLEASAPDGLPRLRDPYRDHEPKIDMQEVESIAAHISATERTAAEAEIESVRIKTLEFFQRQLDTRNPQVFRANVIDIRNYGLMIELPDVLTTGLVHISSLTDDFYLFQPDHRCLLGRRSHRRFRVGDSIRVFVTRVDPFKREIDFTLADQFHRKKR